MLIYKILQKSPKLQESQAAQLSLQDLSSLGRHGSRHLWKRDLFFEI